MNYYLFKDSENYWLRKSKKKLNAGVYDEDNFDDEYWYSSDVDDFCAREFESLVGIKLKRWEIVPIKITKLKNGFKFEVVKRGK